MPQECPKCSGFAWYEVQSKELVLRCLCGYYQVVYTELQHGATITRVQKAEEVSLPRKGTRMASCLGVVARANGSAISTKEVSLQTGYTSSDAATYLMVLQHRGLVLKVTNGKGKTGGSSWQLTHRAVRMMRI